MNAAPPITHPLSENVARALLAIAVARAAVARGRSVDLRALHDAVAALRPASARAADAGPGAGDVIARRLRRLEDELAALDRECGDPVATAACA